MNTVDLLKKLCLTPGVSGNEAQTADEIYRIASLFTSDITVNALGSITAKVNNGAKETLLLCAHMDKIGLIITGIDENSGFLRIFPVGGTDARCIGAKRVKVFGKKTLDGVIISTPPHLASEGADKKVLPVEAMAIDCGLPYDEVKQYVSVGDFAALDAPFCEMANGTVCAPFLDDAAGCAVLLNVLALTANKACRYNLECVFSTREEIGKAGAATAAFISTAQKAIAVDVSFAYIPGMQAHKCAKAGSGAMIGISPVLHKQMSDALIACATQNHIPYTIEVMGSSTGTDADVLVNTALGKCTGLVSIPLKNMHTPAEQVKISDIDNASALIAAFITGGDL